MRSGGLTPWVLPVLCWVCLTLCPSTPIVLSDAVFATCQCWFCHASNAGLATLLMLALQDPGTKGAWRLVANRMGPKMDKTPLGTGQRAGCEGRELFRAALTSGNGRPVASGRWQM